MPVAIGTSKVGLADPTRTKRGRREPLTSDRSTGSPSVEARAVAGETEPERRPGQPDAAPWAPQTWTTSATSGRAWLRTSTWAGRPCTTGGRSVGPGRV